MKRQVRGWVLTALILGLGLVSWGCASGQEPQPSPTLVSTMGGMIRSNAAGNVTIEVEWIGGPTLGGTAPLRFQVDMNTHSVDLDGYDLGQLALLRDNRGRVLAPTSWDSPKGGHHRSSVLIFSSQEQSFVTEDTNWVELVIRDVAGVGERIFRWEIGF